MEKKKLPPKIFKFINMLARNKGIGHFIIDFIAKSKSFYILNKEKRNQKYRENYLKYQTYVYGYFVLEMAKSVGDFFWCGGWSSAGLNTVLGKHVNFNGMKIEGNGPVKIGNYFHSGSECLMVTQSHNYDKGQYIPYDNTFTENEGIEIEDFVWLGSRVMLLPGTKIGEGAIIQGGAVVHGEIPRYAVAGGNPAKVFKYRDKEHFEELKAKGMFY